MSTLMRTLEKTPLKRRLLPGYTGPCSVGVEAHPETPDNLVVVVHLPPNSAVPVAPKLEVENQKVEVLVRHDYRPIRALSH